MGVGRLLTFHWFCSESRERGSLFGGVKCQKSFFDKILLFILKGILVSPMNSKYELIIPKSQKVMEIFVKKSSTYEAFKHCRAHPSCPVHPRRPNTWNSRKSPLRLGRVGTKIMTLNLRAAATLRGRASATTSCNSETLDPHNVPWEIKSRTPGDASWPETRFPRFR